MTSAEAYAKRDEYEAKKRLSIRHEADGITLEEYAEKWLSVRSASM